MQHMTMNLPHSIQRNGRTFRISVIGMERDDGTWEGRLQFSDGDRPVTTEQETSQPSRDALEYWATGLEEIYFEGALRRAIETSRRRART